MAITGQLDAALAAPSQIQTIVERVSILESKGSEDHVALIRIDKTLMDISDQINELRRELGLQPILIDIQP
jgi:hypothetical protein